MEVLFTCQFLKQLKKITDKLLAKSIETAIANVKNAVQLTDIKNIKKLQGSSYAYRIRIGDYRIGIYCMDNTVEFACIMNRQDDYGSFP